MRTLTHQSMRHRGIAMPLVLISLAMATILAAGYLASRDNSGAIGENVAAASAARWAATSGLEIGVAVLQTETDWRTSHDNGKLLDDYPIGTGELDIDVLDSETAQPPTEETTWVELRTTATFEGNQQVATAKAYVPLPGSDETVSLDLTEFAVFAADEFTMEDDAVVAVWGRSPLKRKKSKVAVGTISLDAGSVSISGGAAPIDATVYSSPGASGLLLDNNGATEVDQIELPDVITMPDTADTETDPPALLDLYPVLSMNGQNQSITADQRNGTVSISNGSNLRIQGDVTWVANHDIEVTNNSRIYINGNVTIIAWDDFRLQDSEVELAPDASLNLMVGRDFELDDSYIGDERADDTRDNTGGASLMDPRRVLISSIEDDYPDLLDALGDRDWELKGNSVAKTSMYAPSASLTIQNQSALYGRAAVESLTLKNDGALYYDPALNTGLGYLNLSSALYDGSNNIKAAFKSLSSLSVGDLLTAATSTLTKVKANNEVQDATVPEAPEAVGVNDPTPRPVDVDFELLTVSFDMSQFESLAAADHFANVSSLVAELRLMSAQVSAFDLTDFVGANDSQRTLNRTVLSITIDLVADKIEVEDIPSARTALDAAVEITDGLPAEADVMVPSATRDGLHDRLLFASTQLSNL